MLSGARTSVVSLKNTCRSSVTMETRTVMQREREEQSSQMSHSMQLSSQSKKRTFTSSDEESRDQDQSSFLTHNHKLPPGFT
ncbi:unnamed protein product [Pleuronectes platessa]|uniref:Uncharacterized protein n=1 Tax=Pleuronectes platessa TaxID=8262 RepID=A0A9N7UDQ8_PLEPL|nr:unnamed protein product [Pleuronectes platessa]